MTENADPLIGTVVDGRYRVLRRLGQGGMGAVYAAVQTQLGREVAIKVLRRDLAAEGIAVERFKREAQVIARLGHPHVVSVVDFGQSADGTLYLVMELLRGEDLAARIRRRGRVPWQRMLHIAEQVARALAGAHAHGIIHRDLKPANILLMNVHGVRDFVKVVDFGIAKLVREGKSAPASLTGGGFVPGTVGYIAPENISGGGSDDPRADPRTDLYSLGVTCFQMLTARLPFVGDSAMTVLMQQMHDDAPRPSNVAELSLPPAIEELVMRLLSRSPEGRPASANAVIGEIAELRRTLTIVDHYDDDALPFEQTMDATMPPLVVAQIPAHAIPNRRRRLAIAGATVATAMAISAAVVMTQEPAQHEAPYWPEPTTATAPLAPPDSVWPSPVETTPTPVPPPTLTPKAKPAPPPPIVVERPPPADDPVEESPPPLHPDEEWRNDAAAILGTCNESCAKVIVARLRALDLAQLSQAVRDGVNECVLKCKRKAP